MRVEGAEASAKACANLRERGFPIGTMAACFHAPGPHPQQTLDEKAYGDIPRPPIGTKEVPLFYQGRKRLHQGYVGKEEALKALGLRP